MAEKQNPIAANVSDPIVVEQTCHAPSDTVWHAITDKDAMKVWSFEIAELKPEVGFEFQFYGGKDDVKYLHRCVVKEVIPRKKFAYSWRYEGYEGNTLVTIELFEEGDDTRVKLTHDGLETLPDLLDFARSNFVEGWTMIIGTLLKNFVERPDSAGR